MIRCLLRNLWRDSSGFVVSSETVLLATLVVVGLIAGLTTLRDQVVQELGDTGQAMTVVNQSHSLSGVVGHSSSTAGSSFADQRDECAARLSDDSPPLLLNVHINGAAAGPEQ